MCKLHLKTVVSGGTVTEVDDAGASGDDTLASPAPAKSNSGASPPASVKLQAAGVTQAAEMSAKFMDIARAQLDQDKEHREHERQLKEQEIKLRQDEADASRKSHQEFMSAILAVVGPGSQAGAAGPVCQMDQNQVRDIVHGPP